jgi:hypothetical protein
MADATTPQAVGLVDFDELEYLREIHQLNDEALAVFASAAGELIEAGWEFLSNNRTGDDPEHVIYSGQGFTEKHLERAAKVVCDFGKPNEGQLLDIARLAVALRVIDRAAINAAIYETKTRNSELNAVLRLLNDKGGLQYARSYWKLMRRDERTTPERLANYFLSFYLGDKITAENASDIDRSLKSCFSDRQLSCAAAQQIIDRYRGQVVTPGLCKVVAAEACEHARHVIDQLRGDCEGIATVGEDKSDNAASHAARRFA